MYQSSFYYVVYDPIDFDQVQRGVKSSLLGIRERPLDPISAR